MVVIYCMHVLVHEGAWSGLRPGVQPDRSGQISGLSGWLAFGSPATKDSSLLIGKNHLIEELSSTQKIKIKTSIVNFAGHPTLNDAPDPLAECTVSLLLTVGHSKRPCHLNTVCKCSRMC